MALVGLLESLMTAKLVDDITDTRSNKTRESWGQGVANIVTGFLGGMGGCAVIGQTMINVKGSGRAEPGVHVPGRRVPAGAGGGAGRRCGPHPHGRAGGRDDLRFRHHLRLALHCPADPARMPRSETAVMLITVAVVSATHNLAIGVGAGCSPRWPCSPGAWPTLSTVERTVVELNGETVATYTVDGELFFASSNDLYTQFDYALDAEPDISRVVIDLHASHLWDASTIAVLDAVTEKYRRHGREVELIGLNAASIQMRERLAGSSTRATEPPAGAGGASARGVAAGGPVPALRLGRIQCRVRRGDQRLQTRRPGVVRGDAVADGGHPWPVRCGPESASRRLISSAIPQRGPRWPPE